MSANYFNIGEKFYRLVAGLVVISMLVSLTPLAVFAEDAVGGDTPLPPSEEVAVTDGEETVPPDVPPTEGTAPNDGETASGTDTGTPPIDGGTASGTDTGTPPIDGGTASGTPSGTDGGDGNGNEGTNGETGTENGETVITPTPTITPDAPDGTQGPDGSPGQSASAGATPDDEVTPVEIISDGLLGDVDSPEEEETTGDIRRTGTHALIETGIATAQGELLTDANSNDIRSELGVTSPVDYDMYTFVATGTNEGTVSNNGLARSTSGDNYARGRSTATVHTGDAVAAFNIANVINTNVVNSHGFMYLANRILGEGQSLDMASSFFPDIAEERALSERCSLLSCVSEDVVYNVAQMNNATITNDALVEAVTGYNEVTADLSGDITTGDAYAAANVINVVNTNIIDSNYRLLTYNAIGDLDGDLVLPTGAQFEAFFSRANGIAAEENERNGKYENVTVNANSVNDAVVDNDLDAYAETGLNESTTSFNANISTGRAESESNTLNKINENTYGGDSLYLLIRVHGEWSGDVVGLPENLTWEWTPLGIVIYNVEAEIAPSAFLSPYDLDSYTANFDNHNRLALENNLRLNAITGNNVIDGGVMGSIKTGNAFASANVMNVANTNIVGTNWTFAVINILGDFDGNVSFAPTDITLTGTVSGSDSPLGPDDVLTFAYTVTNKSDSTATNVVLDQTLQSARTEGGETTQSASVGTLLPGATKSVAMTARVNQNIPYGTTSVVAYASVTSDQGDVHVSDNLLMLSMNAVNPQPLGGAGTSTGTGTTTGGGMGTTTGNGTSTTTDNDTGTTTSGTPVVSEGGSSSGGGGGTGGSSSKKVAVKRDPVKKTILPDAAPLLSITKIAVNLGKSKVVKAGESVDYKIILTNDGGKAYDAFVFDVLKNPIDSVMNEQSWDLGTILPGESIELTYTTEYNENTPSGKYTNTASVKAYPKEGMKAKNEAPLKVKDAVSIVEVRGLDLAIGNVEVLAYFPGQNGKTSALVSWETSKPSVSQIFYGVQGAASPNNETVENLGYPHASFMFPLRKAKHMMIITDLQPGKTHAYRIHAETGKFKATSREYTFTIPAVVARVMLATPISMVAGAATTSPLPPPLGAPAPKFIAPKETPKPTPAPVPAVPGPTTTSSTSQAPEPTPEKQGGVTGFVKNIFGKFFR